MSTRKCHPEVNEVHFQVSNTGDAQINKTWIDVVIQDILVCRKHEKGKQIQTARELNVNKKKNIRTFLFRSKIQHKSETVGSCPCPAKYKVRCVWKWIKNQFFIISAKVGAGKRKMPYFPVYKSIPCISRPIFSAVKNLS